MTRYALLLVLFMPFATLAQLPKSETELRALGDRIMAGLVKGGVKAAFAEMKPHVVIPESEFESVMLQSQAQRDQFGARYGKTTGYEFIGQRKVGDSLVRLVYIEKTDKHAMPWTFYFYKGPAGWLMNSFHWNDQLPQLFHLGH